MWMALQILLKIIASSNSWNIINTKQKTTALRKDSFWIYVLCISALGPSIEADK